MSATYTNLLVHLVYSTKHRAPLIHESFRRELCRYVSGIVRGEKKCKVVAINAVEDHLHVLLRLSPAKALSDLVRAMKANSSHWMNDRKLANGNFRWQDGYSGFSVSESQADRVNAYIKRQQEHHRRTSFRAELLALLKRHSIEYDERYLWD
jgi:putative transposase